MNIFNYWGAVLTVSFTGIWLKFIDLVPSIIGAIIVFIIGLFMAEALGRLTARLLKKIYLDRAVETTGLRGVLGKVGFKIEISKALGLLVSWFLYAVVLVAAADILGLRQISDFLHSIVWYIPNVIIAVVILIVGIIVSNFIKTLVKETSLSKFDGKIEAHVTVLDIGNAGEIVFPHFEASTKKIVILNESILAEIKDGKINFDILVATPVTMPRLLPFAKLLGPKGLMPNPKTGTLTDKPEEAVKKLSVAKTMIKTEKKAPVIHMVVGQVSQNPSELEVNVLELIKVIKPVKIKKLALCATMGPSVKVVIEK